MNFESSAIDQVITAITNYGGYTTTWDKTIFEVQDFDTDIPSGNIHSGLCPFVAIRGGLSDDYTQVAGDLYSGTTDLEIYIAVTAPLIYSRASWDLIHTFTGEIERAIATLDGNGFRMSPDTSKSNPVSLNQLLNRVLTISIEGSECREAAGPPSFQSPPVLTGTPKEGYTLSVTNGTVIGTEPITYSYDWLKDSVSIGAPDQNTYDVVAGDVGSTISCEVTASNGIPDDATEESNGLEVVAMLPPVNTVAPAITGTPEPDEVLTCSDGTWTGEAPITFTYTWYKDTVLIPLETANTYTVLAGDVGSDIGCVVLASNIVTGVFPAGVEAASNLIEIVSGWVGIEDSYPGAELIYSNFIQRNAYAGNAQTIRVIATPSDIGFVANKFDGDAWDTATTSGANAANATDWYDQSVSANTASQVSAPKQSPIDRDGAMIEDYINTYGLVTGNSFTSNVNEKITLFFNFNATIGTTVGWLYSWDGTVFSAIMASSNLMRMVVGDSGNIQFNVSAYVDGQDHLVAVTADGTDITIEIDNVQLATHTTGYNVSISNKPVYLNTSSASSGISVNALKDFILYNGISFTPSERTDIYDIWTTQNV
jgi:hypothetical protein